MEEKREVIDVSGKTFRDELVVLSNICEKLNNIYNKDGQKQKDNLDSEEDKVVIGESEEKILKLK